MKKLIALFVILVGMFLGTWTYKIRTPVNRPDEYLTGYDKNAGAWWMTGKVATDDNWMLDPTIESNYVPVPGEENLFMVIDENGNIIKYRKRTKDLDGSWSWTDVNPDIPEDYEPVAGLENVYKVSYSDGSIKYLKYIRNNDGSYAFVEVDENGNLLNHNDDATKIDNKHVHITGNYYRLLDDNGVTIGYERRVDNGDGTFSWVTSLLDLDQIAEGFSGSAMGNEDSDSSPGIDPNNGFLDQYRQQMAEANSNSGVSNYTINVTPGSGGNNVVNITPGDTKIINNSDGTHTQITVSTETRTVNGYTVTYQTTVTKTYDAAGNLLNSQSEGPIEVSREMALIQNDSPVQGDIRNKLETLPAEYARVCGSYTYDEAMASEVIAALNAERISAGRGTLQITDTATQIAKLRAADMAAYHTSAGELPTYGTLGAMLAEYGIASSAAGENIWMTTNCSADEIDIRFSTAPSAYETRMIEGGTQVGIAVCSTGGAYYICEVIL